MTRTNEQKLNKILPVIFGGDVGAYTLGLECYEAFGVRSINVANGPVDLITRSSIFDVIPIPAGATDKQRIQVLERIAKGNPDRSLLLLANNDALVAFFSRNRDHLQRIGYSIPFPETRIIDLLTSKISFAKICDKVGALTPPSVTVDMARSAGKEWVPPAIDFRYPLIAKPDSSEEYESVDFPGKRKIWILDTPEEAAQMWMSLADAGFRGKFLVQEIIPGDDTCKRTVTLYVDSKGKVTLRAAGQVLLEDPTPTMIGNPSAMISRSMPDLWDSAQKILEELNYRGFANFDLKIDPRDGTPYFFELNPRAGRSSYFIVAGGQNPMEIMGRDLVAGQDVAPADATRHALYTLLPTALILKYVKEPQLNAEIRSLIKEKKVVNPLYAPVEKDVRRKVVVRLQGLNFFRKFKQFYRSDL